MQGWAQQALPGGRNAADVIQLSKNSIQHIKKEETNRKCYHSLQELQLSIFEYIEGYYNSKRPHSIYLLQTKQKLSISKDFLEKLRRTYAAIDNKMNMRCKYEEFLEYGENEK